MLDILEETIKICLAFKERKIPYALCGGLALAVHGLPRYTKDIDIIIRKRDLNRALKALDPLDFVLPTGIIPFKRGTDQFQEIYRISKADGEHLLMLDLILLSPILENIWKDRRKYKVGDHQIVIVSRDGLIAMKQLAGRPQDLVDIERLKQHGAKNT